MRKRKRAKRRIPQRKNIKETCVKPSRKRRAKTDKVEPKKQGIGRSGRKSKNHKAKEKRRVARKSSRVRWAGANGTGRQEQWNKVEEGRQKRAEQKPCNRQREGE